MNRHPELRPRPLGRPSPDEPSDAARSGLGSGAATAVAPSLTLGRAAPPTPASPAGDTVAALCRRHPFALVLGTVAALALFWPGLSDLAAYLWRDSDVSHGLLVPGISAAILFRRRRELTSLPAARSLWGLGVLTFSLCLFAWGHRTGTNLVVRAGIWGSLVGGLWFLLGTLLIRRHPFPFFYLLLCIPPPFLVLSPLRRMLKAIATRIAADALSLLGVPALPLGNVLAVGDVRLEVADACSGIRSLMAIVATAVLFAYLFRTGFLKGALLTATAIPVTVLVNVLRIVIVAVALTRFDIDLTEGMRHDLVGLAVFASSLAFLYASWRFYAWLLRAPGGEP